MAETDDHIARLAYRAARAINRGQEPYAPYVGELTVRLKAPGGIDWLFDIIDGMREEWSEQIAQETGDAQDLALRVYNGLVKVLQELKALPR